MRKTRFKSAETVSIPYSPAEHVPYRGLKPGIKKPEKSHKTSFSLGRPPRQSPRSAIPHTHAAHRQSAPPCRLDRPVKQSSVFTSIVGCKNQQARHTLFRSGRYTTPKPELAYSLCVRPTFSVSIQAVLQTAGRVLFAAQGLMGAYA